MNRPQIDVIIPTLDRLEMLREAIDTIRAQTYPHWVITVADNGSTDGSIEWLESEGIAWTHAEIRGAGAARNAGIIATTNPLLYFLDSDDLAEPYALETLVNSLEENGVDLSFGVAKNEVITPGIQIHQPATLTPAPLASSSLLRRTALDTHGLFPTDNHSWVSWYLDAKERGLTEAPLNTQICVRRIHGTNVSSEAGAKSTFFDLIRSRLAQKRAQDG